MLCAYGLSRNKIVSAWRELLAVCLWHYRALVSVFSLRSSRYLSLHRAQAIGKSISSPEFFPSVLFSNGLTMQSVVWFWTNKLQMDFCFGFFMASCKSPVDFVLRSAMVNERNHMNGVKKPVFVRSRHCWLSMVLVACTGSCSLMLDFDEKNRPCGKDEDGDGVGDCLDGYRCLGYVCVEEGSIEPGQTCTADAMCKSDWVCAQETFTCQAKCDSPFDANVCAVGSACVPILGVHDTDPGRAACMPSDCTDDLDDPCHGSDDTTCVSMPRNSPSDVKEGICYPLCQASLCGNNGCIDDCGSENTTCHPIESGSSTLLVCLPTGNQKLDAECDLHSLFCDNNLVCKNSVCRLMCVSSPVDSCPSETFCTNFPGSPYGYCSTGL